MILIPANLLSQFLSALSTQLPLFLLTTTILALLGFTPSTAALTLQSTWSISSPDISTCVQNVPFKRSKNTGYQVTGVSRIYKLKSAMETHVGYRQGGYGEAGQAATACATTCESPEASCEMVRLAGPTSHQSSSSSSDNHHLLLPTSLQSDLFPLALPEALQATILHMTQLGMWKGFLGSLAVLWILVGAIFGCILSIGIWIGRRESEIRERDRRREEVVQARTGRFKEGQRIARRVRWLDQIEGGYELEKLVDDAHV